MTRLPDNSLNSFPTNEGLEGSRGLDHFVSSDLDSRGGRGQIQIEPADIVLFMFGFYAPNYDPEFSPGGQPIGDRAFIDWDESVAQYGRAIDRANEADVNVASYIFHFPGSLRQIVDHSSDPRTWEQTNFCSFGRIIPPGRSLPGSQTEHPFLNVFRMSSCVPYSFTARIVSESLAFADSVNVGAKSCAASEFFTELLRSHFRRGDSQLPYYMGLAPGLGRRIEFTLTNPDGSVRHAVGSATAPFWPFYDQPEPIPLATTLYYEDGGRPEYNYACSTIIGRRDPGDLEQWVFDENAAINPNDEVHAFVLRRRTALESLRSWLGVLATDIEVGVQFVESNRP